MIELTMKGLKLFRVSPVLCACILAVLALSGSHRFIAGSSTPTAPNAAWFVPGAVSTYTSSSVNTSGAGEVVVTVGSAEGLTISVEDMLDGTTLTALTSSGIGGSNAVQIFYEQPSTTGSGATFKITSSGTLFGTMSVIPILGVTGVYDGNLQAQIGGVPCRPGSLTPGSGNHMVVTAVSANNTATMVLSSPYTTVGESPLVGGVNYGGAAGYYATGSATNPSFSNSTEPDVCQAASFH